MKLIIRTHTQKEAKRFGGKGKVTSFTSFQEHLKKDKWQPQAPVCSCPMVLVCGFSHIFFSLSNTELQHT